jgi:cysteine desulfurase
MSRPIVYLDYAATTPVDPHVIAAMTACLGTDGVFANPSSTHPPGMRAKELVEQSRRKIAERVGARPQEIIFTSGATESNNLALKGVMRAAMARRSSDATPRLVTNRLEHKSILDSARALRLEGIAVDYVAADEGGAISVDAIDTAITDATRLVSIMHVNNETGVAQDVESIAAICRERGVLFHFDAAQSVGKLPIRLNDWGIDLCSLTAHKICGPKGIGALYVREGVDVDSFIHGGEQERGLRAGTLATHQIVGMGESYALAEPQDNSAHVGRLSEALWQGLESIDGVRRNGRADAAIPNIVNVRFPGVDGESLRFALRDLAVSAGSACNSDVPEPSYVLTGLGLSDALAGSSIRFSLGRFTTREEVDYAVERVRTEVQRLRRMAPSAPSWCSA